MLSFFRKKSASDITSPTTTTSTTQMDGIIKKIEQLPGSLSDAGRDGGGGGDVGAASNSLQTHEENLRQFGYNSLNDLKETIYDILRTIKDPEKPSTLEDLNVVYEEGIFIQNPTSDNVSVIRVEFNPTVPHCSLATLIGLCIRVKIERNIPHKLKLDIYIKKGAHSTEEEINKQINDKERIAAAMENPNLKTLVEECIKEEE